jgi:hypothetical protein
VTFCLWLAGCRVNMPHHVVTTRRQHDEGIISTVDPTINAELCRSNIMQHGIISLFFLKLLHTNSEYYGL